MGKTYKTTVTLRKKSLSKGRKSLILDYYIGNIDTSCSNPVGKRIRQHLGLYLIPEKTEKDVETNLQTMTKANQILEAKKREINSQPEEDNSGCYNLIKDEYDEQDRLAMFSVRLRKCPLRNGDSSLYLDINVGDNELALKDRVIKGRKKVYLFLHLKPEISSAAIIENGETLTKAKQRLIETINAIEGLIRDKNLRAACRSNLQDFNEIEDDMAELEDTATFDKLYNAVCKLDDLF